MTTKPEFIPLPSGKAGVKCPHTGLTRSYLYSLITPNKGNGNKPPVKSISLRKRGAKHGPRLINYDSIMAYLKSFETPTP